MRFCKYFNVESVGRYVRVRLDSRQELTVAELEKILDSMPMGYLSYYYLGVGRWENQHAVVEDYEEEFVDCSIFDNPSQVCGVVSSDWLDRTVVRFEVNMILEREIM